METFRRIERKRRYEADIVVFDPDGLQTELIVEVKATRPGDLDEETRPLREAMLWVNCHNALLVTPEEVFVFRDTFKDSTPDAIQMAVGQPLSTKRMLGSYATGRSLSHPEDLTRAVAEWLQAMSVAWYDALPVDDEVICALLPEVVGAIAQGQVQRGMTIWYE